MCVKLAWLELQVRSGSVRPAFAVGLAPQELEAGYVLSCVRCVDGEGAVEA